MQLQKKSKRTWLYYVFTSLILLLIITHIHSCPQQEDGSAPPALLELMQVLGLHHHGDLESIMEATQKAWIRKRGKERWEIEDPWSNKADTLRPLLKELGFVDAIHAQKKHYDYAVFLGATAQRMHRRLAFLIQEWKRGVRFDKIVFLVGKRPLFPEKEAPAVIFPDGHFPPILPQTETEIMKAIWERAPVPAEMRQLPHEFIDAPLIQNSEGKMNRPTTASTIQAWLQQSHPQAGSILAISDQPYILYQQASLKTILGPPFVIEAIGDAEDQETIAVFLDSVARWIFEENKYIKKWRNDGSPVSGLLPNPRGF